MKRRAALAIIACLTASAACADGDIVSLIKPADKAKLAAYETVRAAAIAGARAGGGAADLAELDKALAGKPQSIHGGVDLRGDWRCRVFKLGKGLPIVVYGWFRCRMSENDVGLRLDKLDGSQRTGGQFYDESETRFAYLGALFYADEKPFRYGQDEKRNQIGYAFILDKNHMRIEFPSPEFESLMDLLEMERK